MATIVTESRPGRQSRQQFNTANPNHSRCPVKRARHLDVFADILSGGRLIIQLIGDAVGGLQDVFVADLRDGAEDTMRRGLLSFRFGLLRIRLRRLIWRRRLTWRLLIL